MSHTRDQFTKYHATAPATWHQIKAITRRCEDFLGREQYKFGLQLGGIGLTCLRKTDKYDWRGGWLYDSTKPPFWKQELIACSMTGRAHIHM